MSTTNVCHTGLRHTEVLDLALSNQVLDRTGHLFNGYRRVDTSKPLCPSFRFCIVTSFLALYSLYSVLVSSALRALPRQRATAPLLAAVHRELAHGLRLHSSP